MWGLFWVVFQGSVFVFSPSTCVLPKFIHQSPSVHPLQDFSFVVISVTEDIGKVAAQMSLPGTTWSCGRLVCGDQHPLTSWPGWVSRRSCCCCSSFCPTAEPPPPTSRTWRCPPTCLPTWLTLDSCLGSGGCPGWIPISESLAGLRSRKRSLVMAEVTANQAPSKHRVVTSSIWREILNSLPTHRRSQITEFPNIVHINKMFDNELAQFFYFVFSLQNRDTEFKWLDHGYIVN